MLKPEAGVLFKVEKWIMSAAKAYHFHLSEDQIFWMLDRSTWQKLLAKKAQALGVAIKEDTPIEKNQLSEMARIYGYIIDASGAPSVTSREFGFVQDYLRNATLLTQYTLEGDFSFLGDNTVMAGYEPHYLGYFYIFPKGKNYANVGVGRFHSIDKGNKLHLKMELDRILRKEGLDGYVIHKKVSSFTPSCSVNKLIWGNTLLVGDAAALCSPLHGGGIEAAWISGRMAAELIASEKVEQYPIRLWKVVGKKLIMEKRISDRWKYIGFPIIHGMLKFPAFLKGLFFNRKPFPQILGFRGKRIF